MSITQPNVRIAHLNCKTIDASSRERKLWFEPLSSPFWRLSRIPRPLRWIAAVGLLPIPGPFDEAILVLVAVPLALFYRRTLADAWRQAKGP